MAKELKPTQYEIDTWEGRKICDKRELGFGYCGSCSLEIHTSQMRTPENWVHSSKKSWYKAFRDYNKEPNEIHYRKVLERIRDWELTSKASCNILRGFARKALEDVNSTQH